MLVNALIGLLPFLASAQAYFILGQPILETTRLDPIVNPGTVGNHVHTIAGGSNFNLEQTYKSMQASTCTTAAVTVDKSNYWVPQLYYYEPVRQTYTAIPVAYMNAYYLPRAGRDGKVSAFPDGLRMLSGTPERREFDTTDPDAKAVSYVCLDYYNNHKGDPAWDQRNNFFSHNCPQGLRAQVNFPPCWDGVNIDSADHKSHMAWPSGGVNGGECSSSHPVRLVSLFYEFIFQVQNFPYNNGSVPTWVWSNGDTSGYGFHGDFINGWPSLINGTNILQRAINECNANDGVGGNLAECPPFKGYLDTAAASSCRPQNPQVAENVGFNSKLTRLPGDNPLWIGNGDKPTYENYTDDDVTFTDFKSVIPTGYNPVGCIAEAKSGRALTGKSFSNNNMTLGACVTFCQSYGFPLAGVEYGRECYCDMAMRNGASNTTLLNSDQCGMPCANNTNENCGGSAQLTLFNNPSLYTVTVKPVTPLPTVWKASGCMTEGNGVRALSGYSTSSGSMTQEVCMDTCATKGFKYAGIEYAGECYCADQFSTGSVAAPEGECAMKCSGDSTEICGGPNRLTTFVASSGSGPEVPASWSPMGCMTELTSGRAIFGYSFTSSSMTQALCTSTCQTKGYIYAGAEYAQECYCSNTIKAGSVAAPPAECNMACKGDSQSMCGGRARLNVWKFAGATDVTVSSSSSISSSKASTSTSTAVANSTSSVTPAASSASSNPVITTTTSTTTSVTTIISSTTSKATTTATTSSTTVVPSSSSSTSLTPSSTSSAEDASATDSDYIGCYTDGGNKRTLNGTSYSDGKAMTNDACMAFCSSEGFAFAGTEYSSECYCGNYLNQAMLKTDSVCTWTCPGNKSTKCGGSWQLSIWSTDKSDQGVVFGTKPSKRSAAKRLDRN